MDSERSTTVLIVVACVFIGAVGGVVVAQTLSNGVAVDGTIPISSPNDNTVYVETSTDEMDLSDISTRSGTVNVVTGDGNMTVYSGGSTNSTIRPEEITGTWTNVTDIDAGATTIDYGPEDKPEASAAQETQALAWRAGIAEDDGTVDFSYSGTSGNSLVTVTGVSAGTRVAAVDASGNVRDEATSDSGGTVTFDELDAGIYDIRIQSFSPNAPTLSNVSPTGGQSSEPTEVSVDVADPDFPRGDAVTVTIDIDGSQVHQETITSNQTVTASVPASGTTGGSHSWSVEATDDYGATTTDSYTYSVPSEITFREEGPPHSIIKNESADPITVEAIFFEDVEESPEIINRTTQDGTMDLDGLPVSSEFAVTVDAPGYHNRTVLLEDIFTQNDVFLINRDRQTVENRFLVSDRTGQFPASETSIKIQAPVNESIYGSGGINWLTVAGDDLGADEAFVTDLIDGKRYRIIVENEAGDQRNLGAYTAETTGTINLNIGSVDLSPTDTGGVLANVTWSNATGTPQVQVAYNDTTENTSAIHVNIYERNNESNVLLDNQTFTGTYGLFTHTETVPSGENETSWVVEIVAERDDGNTVTIRRIVGPGAPVLTDMPSWLVTIVFVGMIWGVAGLFSQLNGHVGGLIVAGLGGMFYFVGLVPGYLGGGVVALALLTAGILFVREGRGGGL